MRFFLHFGVNPGPTGTSDVLFALGNVCQALRLCSPCAEQIDLQDFEISVNMVIAPIKMPAIRSRSMPVFCERLVTSGLISPKHSAALKSNRGCAVLVRRRHWKSSVRESSFNVPRRLLPRAIWNGGLTRVSQQTYRPSSLFRRFEPYSFLDHPAAYSST